MKLRLRIVDEYAEPLKREQFYCVLWRELDQRGMTPIHRRAVLEMQVEKSTPTGPWGTSVSYLAWEPIEITQEET
jgi:hypothetical protein